MIASHSNHKTKKVAEFSLNILICPSTLFFTTHCGTLP